MPASAGAFFEIGPLPEEGVHVSDIVRPAQPADIPALAALFDAYRRFYEQQSDLGGAEAFLRERMEAGDSVLLVACPAGSQPIGFTQLYPSFSSVSMRRIFILNDLFVAPEARRTGVARSLLEAARAHAASAGALRLSLATALDNRSAQRLYEAEGYVRDEVFLHYDLRVY